MISSRTGLSLNMGARRLPEHMNFPDVTGDGPSSSFPGHTASHNGAAPASTAPVLAGPSSLCERCQRPLLTKPAGLCDSCEERKADLRHDLARGWCETDRDLDAGLAL